MFADTKTGPTYVSDLVAQPDGGARQRLLTRGIKAAHTQIHGFVFGPHAIALADQAVVSGASFLTTVLIGRWTNASELGIYAVAGSILATVLAVQDSLVTLPYTIQAHRLRGSPVERAGSALAHSFLLAVAAAMIAAVVALSLRFGDPNSKSAAMTWVVILAAPAVLLREFGRRFSFAHLHMREAAAIDVAVSTLQLSALCWLQWTDSLSALTAVGATSASCAIVGLLWLLRGREKFTVRVDSARTAMSENWNLAKWLLASRLTVQVQWFITYWLSVSIMGAATAGIYTACMSVVAFANPLITGLGNILAPRAVGALNADGVTGLRRQAILDTLFLGAVIGSFCVLLFFASEPLLHALFPGKEYGGYGTTVFVLSLASLAQALGSPAATALAAMEKPHAIVSANIIAAVLTVILVGAMLIELGLLGAAFGFLVGSAFGTFGLWWFFLSLVRQNYGDPARVADVARNLDPAISMDDCVITRLGQGEHAFVASIQLAGAREVWGAYRSLAIKLYNPEVELTVEMVRAQFDGLIKFHRNVNGRILDGWRIVVPEALYVCASPLALAMSQVPGRSLYSWATSEADADPDTMNAIAQVIVGALENSWKNGSAHGDLALQNILCDVQSKLLSFIDCGTVESCRTCSDLGKSWSPATRDLAHMVSDVATDVKRTIFKRRARARLLLLLEGVLRAFLEKSGTIDETRWQLAQIRECALAHVDELMNPSLSLRGAWQWVVKRLAWRRMDSMFGKFEREFARQDVAARSN